MEWSRILTTPRWMMGLIVGEAADKHAGEATASVRAAGFDAFIKMLKDEDTI